MNVTPFWTFIDENAPGVVPGEALSVENDITSGLRQVLALYCGAVEVADNPKLNHTPILRTGVIGRTLGFEKVTQFLQSGRAPGGPMEGGQQTIAMIVEGKSAIDSSKDGEDTAAVTTEKAPIRAGVYCRHRLDVADLLATSCRSKSGAGHAVPVPKRHLFAQHN